MHRTNTYPAGTLIDGRYRIERKLGHGGFATVYQAEHIQLGRRAAIKVLEPIHARGDTYSAQFRARFNDEARIAANLDHPNVVRIFDFGFIDDERPYIAMELLDGCDLEQQLREGPLDPERAKRLFLPVLDALRVGHERGIVHKDLKPANLFLVKAGTPDEKLIILDYGIARQESDANPRHTEEGTYTGTPAYMPPEYIHRREVIPANDVYQIGLILTEALTGQPVVQAKSQLAYMVAHVNGQRQLPEGFGDSALGAVLLRALEVDPANRFSNAGEMLRALRGARIETGADFTLHNVPALAEPPGETEREAPKQLPKKSSAIVPLLVVMAMATFGVCGFAALLLSAFLAGLNDEYSEYGEYDEYWTPDPPTVPTMFPTQPTYIVNNQLDEMYSWLLARHMLRTVLYQVDLYEAQRKIEDWPNTIGFVPSGIDDLMSIMWQQIAVGMESSPKRAKLENYTTTLSPQAEALQQTLTRLYDYHTVRRGWEQDNGAQGVVLTRELGAAYSRIYPSFQRWSTMVDDELMLTLQDAEDRYSGDTFMLLATRCMIAEAELMRELDAAPKSAATTAALAKFDTAFDNLAAHIQQQRDALTARYKMTAGLHERFLGSLRDTRKTVGEVRSSGEALTPLTAMSQHMNFGTYRTLGSM